MSVYLSPKLGGYGHMKNASYIRADSEQELDEFALQANINRHWRSYYPEHSYYFIPSIIRDMVIKAGAIELTKADFYAPYKK